MANSCSSERYEDYSTPAQSPIPTPVQNSSQYYYGQPQYQRPYQQPSPYYYPPQQPSYYPPATPYSQQGGSRYYSNPYAIPPSTQYPNYDADQYYVPPTYYNNVETLPQKNQFQSSGAGNTF
ncbi:MAG: hypothetical protein KA100_00600 [Rickettsiales bacterium]|nr:hypothetical protein [Rickettsiales bacterium]